MNQKNRRVLCALVVTSCFASPLYAQNATSNQMAARTREWRLDGTIVGLDSKRGVLRLQPDVLVMRAEGDAVEMGAARETATRLIVTDAATQIWTPDGKLQPLQFAALRTAAQIIAIGPLQNEGEHTVLHARLLMLSDGLPADYRAQQVLAAPVEKIQTPPQISPPTTRPQVLAPAIAALKTPPQVLAVPQTPPQISLPATRPQPLAPPQISAPENHPQVLAAPIVAATAPQVLAPSLSPMRQAPIPLPVAPPIINRAPQNDETRLAAITPDSATESLNQSSPNETETQARPMLSGDDWSRRVSPPVISVPSNKLAAANLPQVLAPQVSASRSIETENRAVQPPNIERALPLKPPLLSANTNSEDLSAPITNFPRATSDKNAPVDTAPQLRATALASAPRDARRPALSLDESSLMGRGALSSALTPQFAAPNLENGRASLRLDDAQTLLQQQQTATLARDNYAQLRAVQNAVPWPTFSNGPGDEKLVALTFDDGPHPTGTPSILAQLRRFNVPATFFVVGRNVELYPDLLREEAAAGHDIANHSWHHFQGVKLSAEQWHEEIAGNNRIIENVLGVAPRWFRAPGCHYSNEALAALRDLDMVRADTSNNSGDWEGGDPAKTVARVLARLAPGQVLLFHDSVPQTAQALPILLRELQARGYRCVTLSELAARAAQVPGFVPEFHPAGQGIVLPTNVAATH